MQYATLRVTGGRRQWTRSTRGKGALNIQMMMGRLLENNPKLHETKVFIVDNDFAEIKAVREVLPDVQIYLCLFHVLKAIRKEAVKLVPRESLAQVLTKVHSMVYASSEQRFDSVLQQLKDLSQTQFMQYLEVNWLQCRNMWALFERHDRATLGNNTNNRIESQFNELKNVISSRRKFSECLRLLVRDNF